MRARDRGRTWRRVTRGVLAVVAAIALVVIAAVAVVHTAWGREIIRAQIEQQLRAVFTGGASLGRVEGSPLGELVLRDLVIRGPDGQPAISVETLTIELALLPLLSHQARVAGLIAEEVEIDLRRDARGELQIEHLLRPGPSSTWSVALPRVALRRGHVRYDTGAGEMNLDGLVLDGRATIPYGGPLDASFELGGTWRERAAAGLDLRAVVHADERGLGLPLVLARAGDVSVRGDHIIITTNAGRALQVGGALAVDAGAAAVARLFPEVRLPADVALTVMATPVAGQPWTDLAIAGRIGRTELRFTGAADLGARHARGELATGALDLTKLTGGTIAGRAEVNAAFDIRPGGPRALPVATATIRGRGEVAGVPRTTFAITLGSAGERARVAIDATGEGVQAKLAASLHVLGDLLAIDYATLHAQVPDVASASPLLAGVLSSLKPGGTPAVHGALRADLTVSGTLRPAPSLAVEGTIDGRHMRVLDLSAAALHVAIDARRLPHRPLGRARVQLVDLVRGDTQLRELTVEAADRLDGKIAVAMRSRPRQRPWLIDADALVTPPGEAGAGTVRVDLLRHRVRAGSGTDWTGHTGHLEIGPSRIVLDDFASTSPAGRLALAGSYTRAGRRRGDLVANLDVARLSLDDLPGAYRGTLDARVAVSRRGGAWQGEVDLDGTRIAIGSSAHPSVPVLDTHAHAALHGTRLTVAADVASPGLGSARLALDLETPAVIVDPAAWKRLDRTAIRTADLTLEGIDLGRAAALAGLGGTYAGRIDGGVCTSPEATSGRIVASRVALPALRGVTVDVVLDLAQAAPTAFTPTLIVTAEGIGKLSAQAQLAIPDRLFDPAAWAQLGPAAVRSATVHAEDIAVDPALLARFGVTSELRGRASIAVDLGEAGRTMQAAVDVAGLRGAGIQQPLDAHLVAQAGDVETTASLSIEHRGVTLLAAQGRSPVSLVQLVQRDARRAIRTRPLDATATLTSVDAAQLLGVFGRTEVIAGRIDGSIELGGTLGAPTAQAALVATGLEVPPGPGGKPVCIVERLAIDGRWDGSAARLAIDGVESDGGTLEAVLEGRPAALDDATVTIQAENFDLVPVLVFAPGPIGGASGRLDANLTLTGLDPRTTRIAGELHLLDARVPIAPSVGTLRQAKIDVVVAGRELRLVVDGKLGAGSIAATGSLALEGAFPGGGQLTIALHKVSPIGALEPQITADVAATLSRDRNQWHADLVVDHGTVIVPSDRGEELRPVGAPPDMIFADGDHPGRRPMAHEAPANPTFLVTIDLRSTRVESEEFRGLVRGRVELRTDGRSIGMFGGINADRGDLDLFGRRYEVARAGVHFDGSLDPLLDVRITHQFPDVTTLTEVHGRASKPELIMSSDPATYSQAQLLGFLLGGDPGGDPQRGAAAARVTTAGASFIANQIGGYVRKRLPIGIDVLRVESSSALSSAAVIVGTWITSSLFLSYRRHLEAQRDGNTGEGQLEYWLSRRLVVEGTVGDRDTSVDLLWRMRY